VLQRQHVGRLQRLYSTAIRFEARHGLGHHARIANSVWGPQLADRAPVLGDLEGFALCGGAT
jgi:hypothetical protein